LPSVRFRCTYTCEFARKSAVRRCLQLPAVSSVCPLPSSSDQFAWQYQKHLEFPIAKSAQVFSFLTWKRKPRPIPQVFTEVNLQQGEVKSCCACSNFESAYERVLRHSAAASIFFQGGEYFSFKLSCSDRRKRNAGCSPTCGNCYDFELNET